MRLTTKTLVNAGLLVAMSVILTRFAAVMLAGNTIRLSFGNIPLYVAGIMFGQVVGGIVGAVADLFGMLINSFGSAFIPQIFVASIMRGIVPGIAIKVLGEKSRNWQWKIFAAILVTEIISGALLTTWGLAWMFKQPFMVILTPRLVALAIQIPIYTMATYALTVALRSLRLQRSEGR